MAEPSHLFSSLPLALCGAEPIINQSAKQGNKKNCHGKNSYLFKIEKKKTQQNTSLEKTEKYFQYTGFDYLAVNKGI